MNMRKVLVRSCLAALMFIFLLGAGFKKAKASDFDPGFYASYYPDVAAAYGTDPNALYSHYLTFGINEGRFKNAQEAATGQRDDTLDTPTTYVDVDLTNQQMIYYVDGVPVISSAIVSGNTSNGNGTPTGVFFINAKVPGKYLVGPTWNVWVNRWMRFTGAVGLHDASWRSEFGGEIYKKNGSHGCVNLPSDVANSLYDMVNIGTMVIVH